MEGMEFQLDSKTAAKRDDSKGVNVLYAVNRGHI